MSAATLALIGLGSNLGDRRTNLEFALTALAATPGVAVRAVSTFHETKPVGGPEGQGTFLNAAALLETTLDAEPLLDILNAVEAQARRVRTVRWGARTLDLDLLLFGNQIVRSARLTVPHPRMALRRFVLAPALEIAPAAIDPVTTRTIAQLLANLDRRPSYLALHGGAGPFKETVFRQLVLTLEAMGLTRSDVDRGLPIPRSDSISANPGDRWLVTDFCLALMGQPTPPSVAPLHGRDLLDPDQASERLQSLQAAADHLPRPTFAVILKPGPDDESLVGVLDFPHLVVDSSDPDRAVAEVLAACASTRS